jgi:hypothetical protein
MCKIASTRWRSVCSWMMIDEAASCYWDSVRECVSASWRCSSLYIKKMFPHHSTKLNRKWTILKQVISQFWEFWLFEVHLLIYLIFFLYKHVEDLVFLHVIAAVSWRCVFERVSIILQLIIMWWKQEIWNGNKVLLR